MTNSSALLAPSAVARFWAKVDKGAPGECWRWTGAPDRDGYGKMSVGRAIRLSAHRYAYLLLKGHIASGMEVDHTCHSLDDSCPGGATCAHRLCVNPAHLEAVTHKENQRRGRSPMASNSRKTHCSNGHPLSGTNLRIEKGGRRRCRTCQMAARKLWRARKREAAQA